MTIKICPGCNNINETRFKYCQREFHSQCLTCNSDFSYKCSSKPPITCSKSCGSKFIMKNRQKINETRQCQCCGEDFIAKAFNSKNCLKEKVIKCLQCKISFTVICNNDYRLCCSNSCSKKYMRENSYSLASKECLLCGTAYKPSSSRQNVCYERHYRQCNFCHNEFLVSTMFTNPQRNLYCDNICSTFAQMNSTINIELINEYKNINKWAMEYLVENGIKPNAITVKEYFGFSNNISLNRIKNINLKFFDHENTCSNLEGIVEEYLKTNYSSFNYIHNYRYKFDDGKRLEIDFYVPELQLGFEVQDFGTHDKNSDNIVGKWDSLKKGPRYHRNKINRYSKIAITVIELWQDDIFSGKYKEIVDEVMSK